MSEFGYDKQRFPNLTGDMFDCPICTNVVRNPKECGGCGDLFCTKCIDDWKKKMNACPKRCNGDIKPMSSPALIGIYKNLQIKCAYCSKVVTIRDVDQHEANCSKAKCWNFQICQGYDEKLFKENSCSQKCEVLNSILKSGGNVKKMYEILMKYEPVVLPEKSKIDVVSSVKDKQTSQITNFGDAIIGASLRWNQTSSCCGVGLQFQNGGQLVILKESAYVFRTAVGTNGFTSGLHYWEVIPDGRTQNQLKIGVTTSVSFDLNTAFCDHIFGYAYYGLGQLRSNSNASGPQYGKRLKKQGVLGVFLNMDKGQLSFSLNGENMGVAFDNPALKKGPIYPAVALLHCAGCIIKGELAIPACFK